jgi:hypothetical protein
MFRTRDGYTTVSRRFLAVIAGLVSAAAATLVAAAPAAADITSRTIVGATTTTNGDDRKHITVTCPTGTVAVGGDAVIVGGNGIPHLINNSQLPVSNGWVAIAEEHPGHGDAGLWRLTVHAICVTGVTGRERALTAFSMPANVHSKWVGVSCPAGKRVIGWGGGISGGTGPGLGQFILTAADVSTDLTYVAMHVTRAISPGNEGLTAGGEVWAVCVDPVPGMQWVRANSATDSSDKALLLQCPAGKRLFGINGGSFNGARSVKIESVVAGNTNALIIVKEMPYGTSADWRAFATAVCAP